MGAIEYVNLVRVVFMRYVKYPRTPLLPWSPHKDDDDIRIVDCSAFAGEEVVITEKMDGENTTMYRDRCHARSIDSGHHPSRSWVKGLHSQIAYLIPEGWRLCGENLYARHSIAYDNLPSYFLLFNIWDDQNVCLSWDETEEWAKLLGLHTVPVLYRGPWNESLVRDLFDPYVKQDRTEGIVVRVARSFTFEEFGRVVAKVVREGHVQTDEHWMHKEVVPNKLLRR